MFTNVSTSQITLKTSWSLMFCNYESGREDSCFIPQFWKQLLVVWLIPKFSSVSGMHSGRIVTETRNLTLCTDPQADKLSSFCIREEHPIFPCDLYIWHFHWCSLTLHPTGSIASFTLNKSEVKEENKGIFQQMAQTPQLYHCRSKRLIFCTNTR